MEVPSRIRDYRVIFPESPSFVEELAALPQAAFVVDQNVLDLYRDGLLRPLPQEAVIPFTAVEENKEIGSVTALFDRLLEHPAKKNLVLVSIGGGITQDVTGFAASTLYRGIEWIYLPTTLLAMADSCIGSKTSLNYRAWKNLVGTFYPPSAVHLHLPFVGTLSELDYASGLGEVAKLRVMGGEDSAHAFHRTLPLLRRRDPRALAEEVRSSLLVKLDFLRDDEFDRGRRNLLNYGHCLGHALETASSYRIPHGQAVVVGMLFADILSRRRSLLSQETERFLAREVLIPLLTAPLEKDDLLPGKILPGMMKDKKRTGKGLAVIMLREGYDLVKAVDVGMPEAEAALADLCRLLEERGPIPA
jgi:3-dehydroquinate synthase